ncbi:MAG: WbqC family protein [Candidatus Saccharimonadaceae bacterium]
MRKIAIMQPYFFPYIGYFSLIKHTDEFMIFDPVQFIRHGWIERNRVLKQGGDWIYVKVPLKKFEQQTLIKDVEIDNSQDWKAKISAQLQPYKKIAPFYKDTKELIDDIFKDDYTDIVTLNKVILEKICTYLGIKANISVYSQLNLEIDTPNAPDEWALNISKSLGDISEYWNQPGGESFFDKSKYNTANIGLKFIHVKLEEYDQKGSKFEPGLSIIDVLMFNSPARINEMLDNYELS